MARLEHHLVLFPRNDIRRNLFRSSTATRIWRTKFYFFQASAGRFSLGDVPQQSNARVTDDHRSATSVRLLSVGIELQREPLRMEYSYSPLSCFVSLLSTTVQFIIDLLNYDLESFDTAHYGLQWW